MFLLGIIIAILVFSVIIFIHELGHFTVAKLSGVRVNEFALGMGPLLFSFKKGETKYSIRALPIGGYVSMEGEDDASDDEHAFCNIHVWKRIAIVLAGAVMNILLGMILLGFLVNSQDKIASTTIANFHEKSTSASMLEIGDEIKKVNGYSVHIDKDIIFAFVRDSDGFYDMDVQRDGQIIQLKDVPFETFENEQGMQQIIIDFYVSGQEKNIPILIKQTWYTTISIVKQVVYSLFDIITGNIGISELSGPIGVTTIIGQAASNVKIDIQPFIMLCAFITINVGVFNLLPLPALDGGRLVFLAIEAVRGKPILPKYEKYIHATGLILLFGLMIFVTFNDIIKLISGVF